MNITINIYGDIYADICDCGCPCDSYDDYVEECDELCDECKRRAEEAEVPGTDEVPGVIVCSIDGMPENIPPEMVSAIANAAVVAVMEHLVGADKGNSHERV